MLDDWVIFIVFALSGAFCAWRAVAEAEERGAWLLIGIGLGFYAFGGVVFVTMVATAEAPPFPSLADWIWLAMYPFLLAGLLLLLRGHELGSHLSVWLDGLVGALALATLGAAVVFEPIWQKAIASVARQYGRSRIPPGSHAPVIDVTT